jgi:hypothetical protein
MKINKNHSTDIANINVTIAKGKSLQGGLLEANNSQVIHVISDSTGNNVDEWPYLIAQKLASSYPYHNIKYKLLDYLTLVYSAWTDVQSYGDDRHVYCKYPGSESYHFQLKASEVTLTSSDLDVTLHLSLDDWQEGTAGTKYIMSRAIAGANGNSWMLYLSSANKITLYWSPDGTNATLIAENTEIDTTSWVDGSKHWIRVKLDVDNGAAGYTFAAYTSADGVTWTQIRTHTGASTTSIHSDETIHYYLGGKTDSASATDDVTGKFYEVLIRDGIDGPIVSPQPIEAWHRCSSGLPAATYEGTPTIYMYNASCSGFGVNDFKVVETMSIAVPQSYGALVFYAIAHNDTGYYDLGNAFTDDLDTLFIALNAKALGSTKIMVTQNPFCDPATSWTILSRAKIRKVLMAYAKKNNMSIIDTYAEFLKAPQGYTTLLNVADGIHPIGDGKTIIFNTIWNQLKLV